MPYEIREPLDVETEQQDNLPFEVETNVAFKEKEEIVDNFASQDEDSSSNEKPNFLEQKYPFECAESEISSDCQQEGSACSNDELTALPVMKTPVGMPHIILQEPDMRGVPRRPTSLHPPPPDVDGVLKRKSPVTVQEWVDHLPMKGAGS